jgi:REP element-mobilizing transposase RayT
MVRGRRSTRLAGFDYSAPGAYFITICTQDRRLLLRDEVVRRVIEKWWHRLDAKFDQIETDEFVVMPNHVHGILMINADVDVEINHESYVGAHPGVRPGRDGVVYGPGPTHRSAPTEDEQERVTLGRIVQWFKNMTTNEYIRRVEFDGWEPFPGRLWQRNYYDHIIRDDNDLNRARRYIKNNPVRWTDDRYYAREEG